jgi:hypothetical protein
MTFRLALMIILPIVFCKFKLILPRKPVPKAMISNNPPVINAGADYTILRDCICVKRTGTDATGDVLTYTWEQNDAAVITSWRQNYCYKT